MIEIVDFKSEHLKKIRLRPCHEGERPKEIRCSAVTFISEGQPIAIFGWYLISHGVAQVWALLSEEVAAHKVDFHKNVKHFVKWGFETFNLRRMQMSVRFEYSAGRRWAESLGFECEGIMKKYGPGGVDYWLFAKVIS